MVRKVNNSSNPPLNQTTAALNPAKQLAERCRPFANRVGSSKPTPTGTPHSYSTSVPSGVRTMGHLFNRKDHTPGS